MCNILPGCPLACDKAKVRQVYADRWAQQQNPRIGSTIRFESMVLYKSKARLFRCSSDCWMGKTIYQPYTSNYKTQESNFRSSRPKPPGNVLRRLRSRGSIPTCLINYS